MPITRRPTRRGPLTALLATVALGAGAVPALAVPVTVPQIVVNDGHTLRATGIISSPPGASQCTALVRSQLQVAGYGGWRVVRAVGRHRISVCEDGESGWTAGSFYTWMNGMERLRSQPARLCWSATQYVNGSPSTHVSCKRFSLRGGS